MDASRADIECRASDGLTALALVADAAQHPRQKEGKTNGLIVRVRAKEIFWLSKFQPQISKSTSRKARSMMTSLDEFYMRTISVTTTFHVMKFVVLNSGLRSFSPVSVSSFG